MRETNDAKNHTAERILWWGIGVVGLVSIVLLWYLLGHQGPPRDGIRPNEAVRRDATTRCEEAVRQRLYAPSSARFPSEELTTTALDESTFVVQGTVESRSGLGIESHDRFRCELGLRDHAWAVRNVVTR